MLCDWLFLPSANPVSVSVHTRLSECVRKGGSSRQNVGQGHRVPGEYGEVPWCGCISAFHQELMTERAGLKPFVWCMRVKLAVFDMALRKQQPRWAIKWGAGIQKQGVNPRPRYFHGGLRHTLTFLNSNADVHWRSFLIFFNTFCYLTIFSKQLLVIVDKLIKKKKRDHFMNGKYYCLIYAQHEKQKE